MRGHGLLGVVAIGLSAALARGAEAPAGKGAPAPRAEPPAAKAPAEKKADAPQKGPAPEQELEHVDSWAEVMVYENQTGRFHLTGNVTVIKGSMRVSCNEMTGEADSQQRQVTRVLAFGNVQIVTVPVVGEGQATVGQDPWHGTCSRADYDLRRDRVEMQGAPGQPRPRLLRAKGMAEADTIIFYPDKGEYELVGDPVIRGDIPVGPGAR